MFQNLWSVNVDLIVIGKTTSCAKTYGVGMRQESPKELDAL